MGAPIIGKGERTAIRIFLSHTKLKHLTLKEYPQDGLYTQVPLPKLLSADYKQDLHPQHVKSSVDIVLVWRGKKYAVYVNGKDHTGAIKSKRDAVRYAMLQKSNVRPVVLSYYELPHLFKEKIDDAEKKWIASLLVPA